MKKIAALAAMSVSAMALSTGIAAAEYELNILHTNDFHSRIESINKYDSTCSAEDETAGECFGGVARIKTKIDERRAAFSAGGGNSIFVIGGDQFQGSLFYTTYKGAADVQFLNKLGVDALALGNHEFDDGPETLAEYVKAANFPVISSNLLFGVNTPLGDSVKPYVIREVGGEKIGIVAATATDTEELSSPGPGILFLDEVDALKRQVAALTEMGVNKIVLVTHVGYNRDKEIAQMVDGIDVIVGGHSNTFLSNTDPSAVGPYPTMVKNPSGKDVPIVQAYAYSKYLGELKVVFDDEGNVISATGDPNLLDASVKPDPEFQAMVKNMAGPIEELKGTIVGETSDAINGNREQCRAQECTMGNLVADAMLDRVKGQGVQIAIQNGGGLRASIDAGEVTMGEVLSVLPFQNTLATFEIKGADIVAALENGVSQIKDGGGRFPQVAGITFTFDKDAEIGSRISNVKVGGDPIDMEATYKVVSNNFMRSGGDGYTAFVTASNAYDFGPGLELVVADYLTKNNPYKPYLDGRIAAAPAMAETEMKTEAPAAEMEKAADVDVMVPQTTLGAGDLASSGPKIEETATDMANNAEKMAAEEMKPEGAAVEEMAKEAAPAADMKKEEMAAETMEKDAMKKEEMAKETMEKDVMKKEEMAKETMEKDAMKKEEMAKETMEKDAMKKEEMAKETMEKDAMKKEEMAKETMEKDAMKKEEMAKETMEMKTYVIKAGDTFWKLAKDFYGDPTMYGKLQGANPEFIARDLKIGETLNVPQ